LFYGKLKKAAESCKVEEKVLIEEEKSDAMDD
jgi:hypothetical protein